MSECLYVYLSVYVSVCLFIHLMHLHIDLFIQISIDLIDVNSIFDLFDSLMHFCWFLIWIVMSSDKIHINPSRYMDICSDYVCEIMLTEMGI